MNCKNCGHLINVNDMFCPNCGNKIENGINLYTPLVEDKNNIDNEYKANKNNNFKRKIAIVFIFEILFFVACILFFIVNNKISLALTGNEFNSKMQNLNYSLKDVSYQYNNLDINSYYLAYDENYNYKIDFIVTTNNQDALVLFDNIINKINTYSGNVVYGMSSVSFGNYKSYSLTSNGEFYVAIVNENTVIYCAAPEEYKTEIEKNLDNIGYIYNTKMNFIIILIILISCTIIIVSWWKIFEKAGIKEWNVLIPIYNFYCMYKIAFGKGWYFFLMLIPFVNLVIMYMMFYKLSKAFGKSNLFALCSILFSMFIIQILAFDNSKYLMKS